MNSIDTVAAVATTARRARGLSAALADFRVTPEQEPVREQLAGALVALACALDTVGVPTGEEARVFHLVRAELSAALTPFGAASGVPASVLTYVLEPFIGRPELPELNPVSDLHAHQERDIKARVAAVRRHLDSEVEEIVRVTFGHLLFLHRKFLHLGEAVALDLWTTPTAPVQA